ncbi:MAG: hypothetical protein WCK11_03020 [Candidatus Falkowbacteria bacterium]
MHHLIFEGAELSGKSWIMSQVYNYLQPKFNQNQGRLDGCHWINSDIGVYGDSLGLPLLKTYCELFTVLASRNLIVEKFYLADAVYHSMAGKQVSNYTEIENKLVELDFKYVLCLLPEDENIIQKRLEDRLRLYPHYKIIAQEPRWYIEQQQTYLKLIQHSKIPCLMIQTYSFPDELILPKILRWLGE